jgi:hypothetical protein
LDEIDFVHFFDVIGIELEGFRKPNAFSVVLKISIENLRITEDSKETI